MTQVLERAGSVTAQATTDAAVDSPTGSRRRLRVFSWRALPSWVVALAIYLALALITIGRYAIQAPRTVCACSASTDPASYTWALSWWPHALLHGLNPFVSHYLWAPTGVNVAQGAMIPTAAILMAPITALAGPVFSYNVLAVCSPALAAFTAYLLCRRLTGRELPALVGGFLFGFSSYQFAQLLGHLNLVLVFLIPVMVLVALRRVAGEMSRRSFVLAMATLLILQAGLSTELLAECVFFGAVVLVAAWLLVPRSRRTSVAQLAAEIAGSGLVAAIVISPFLYYALFSGGTPQSSPSFPNAYSLDLLNLWFPTTITWLGGHDFYLLGLTFEKGNGSEANGYLGVIPIALFLMWVLGRRRNGNRVFVGIVATGAAVSLIAALGPHLHIAGYETITLPFSWFQHLSLINNIAPGRMILFTSLALSVGIASYLAGREKRVAVGWLAILLGIVMIIPDVNRTFYGAPVNNPRFFSTALYKRYLRHDETVLVLPFALNDVSMLWQAEGGFNFFLPEGYVSGTIPPPFNSQLTTAQLFTNVVPPAAALDSFIREHRVSHVIVDPTLAGPWPGVLAQLGLSHRLIGGVMLYTVPDAPA
jgi:hypothetical protein